MEYQPQVCCCFSAFFRAKLTSIDQRLSSLVNFLSPYPHQSPMRSLDPNLVTPRQLIPKKTIEEIASPANLVLATAEVAIDLIVRTLRHSNSNNNSSSILSGQWKDALSRNHRDNSSNYSSSRQRRCDGSSTAWQRARMTNRRRDWR